MGRNRFVTPETVRLDIGNEDWIDVKKRLTIGELRKSQTSAIKDIRGAGENARYTPSDALGKAEVLAYLIDWGGPGFQNGTGTVKIDTDDKKRDAIDQLDPDDFEIISGAITKHVEKMEAERAESKKMQAGERNSSAITPSAVS